MEESTASKRELQDRSYQIGSCSTVGTVGTVESDWLSVLEGSSISISLNPWSIYQIIRNARLLTVEPVIILFFFGLYLMFPLNQQYYLERVSEEVLQNTSYFQHENHTTLSHCIDKADVNNYTEDNTTYGRVVESKGTQIYVYRSMISTVLAIASSLITGPLSDRYGRRLIILLAAVGGVFQGLGSLAIAYLNLNLYYFLILGVVEGCFGNFAAILLASFAYLSDITSVKWRTVRFSIAESMIYLSGLIALKSGGLWFQKLDCDVRYPLYLYTASNIGIILYTILFLPESLTSEERRRKSAGKSSGIKALIRGVRIFFCQVTEYRPVVWMLWCALLSFGVTLVIIIAGQSIGVFYMDNLNWSPKKTGNWQTVSSASHAVALMVVLPILVALKLPDPLICLMGVAFNVSMNLLIGLSSATSMLFLGESFVHVT
jgi:PCFT/HCP family folate transporter-like MFS transporter 1/3